jgi:hypothetical protein
MSYKVTTANELYFGNPPDSLRLQQMERNFFKTLGLPNGTFKTTYHRRLDDLNELVAQQLPADRPLQLMDVAVSSGVSTAEWTESLSIAGIEHQMLAGDILVDAFLISVGKHLRALVDRNGHTLQLDVGGNGIRYPPRKRDWVYFGLPILLLRRVAAALRPTLRDAHGDRAEGASPWGVKWRALKLVSPSLGRSRHIEVVEDDILTNQAYPGRFHALRAANILNLGYFDDRTITAMLVNLRSRLRPGGLLVVCRTCLKGVNRGSVFQLRDDGSLAVVARLNGGSEIESLAAKLPRSLSPTADRSRA